MIQEPHEKRGELYCCCMLGVSEKALCKALLLAGVF